MPEGRRPRGVNLPPRSGAAVGSARLRRRRNGREELPCVRSQGRRQGGATPCARLGAPAGRNQPTAKERWLLGAQEGLEELSHVEGQEGLR